MKIASEISYAGPIDDVIEVLNSRELADARAKKLGLKEHDFAQGEIGGQPQSTFKATVPAEQLPQQARSFLSKGVSVTIVATPRRVDGGAAIAHDVQIKGVPASVDLAIMLADAGATTPGKISGDVNVKIPFVGSKIEKMVAAKFSKVLEQDADLVNTILAGRH